MKIVIASDHGGFKIKEAIKAYLSGKGYTVEDLGTDDAETSVDYPVYAKALCRKITNGEAKRGILCCGTGIGMSIAANKQSGIRAAVLSDEFSAEMTRRHNDSNVLCLGGRLIDDERACELSEIFLTTEFEGGRHVKRVEMFE